MSYDHKELVQRESEEIVSKNYLKVDNHTWIRNVPDGAPCKHKGCLSHESHPCEECNRIKGVPEFHYMRKLNMETSKRAEEIYNKIENMSLLGVLLNGLPCKVSDMSNELSFHTGYLMGAEETRKKIIKLIEKMDSTWFGNINRQVLIDEIFIDKTLS